MNRVVCALVLLFLCGTIYAQSLAVTDFHIKDGKQSPDPTCAVVEIDNMYTGFSFEEDDVPVAKMTYVNGGIWVYVKPNTQILTIRNARLQTELKYRFPEPIEGSMVYSMALRSGRHITITTDRNDDIIHIDGRVAGYTPLNIVLPFGQHRVQAQRDSMLSKEETIDVATDSADAILHTISFSRIQSFSVNGVSFDMVEVEGGTFAMGATKEQRSEARYDEFPVHKATVETFMIGKTEVTNQLWKAVMQQDTGYWRGANLPAVGISWNDCKEFIRRLNQLTGCCFRLPTEVEWEFAARGGNNSMGFIYSGSNYVEAVAWMETNSRYRSNPVASKLPNELGIYDMTGNAYEWCEDVYSPYGKGRHDDENSSASQERVYRGGSWGANESFCRVSCRHHASADYRHGDIIGLRLALDKQIEREIDNRNRRYKHR